ncbi:small ubiquitin-related modifier domain-containing protein [Aspergillus mulundensis]|uniref:Rad60/SUMO-like domain-containing protein n=1 Tax=Aspergillus mulundensis TaxID=1810919 RepID=A0A3D8Q6F2_9EURO|nr:hypothetical protein DSM5745_11486 [Aspergillus mulundensis]RDW57402.1 hypothetical protein DSM5745_11486 [Aspergillus mulundensis]
MRSFFKKPAWASQRGEDEDPEFYRRGPQVYRDIVATTKSAQQRRASSPVGDPHRHKRQRHSIPSHDGTNPSGIAQGTAAELRASVKNPHRAQISPGHSSSNTSLDEPQATHQLPGPNNEASTTSTKGLIPPTPEVSPQSKLLVSKASPAPSPPVTINIRKADAYKKGVMDGTRSPSNQGITRSARDTAYDNTVVHILITSELANTKPLIIQRKMSQSLKGVRLAWCARQNLPNELHQAVFLTWKGRRLFDVTTCRSLNISAHAKEQSPFDEFFTNEDECHVNMEAVTEEIHAARHRSPPNMVQFNQTSPVLAESQNAGQHAGIEIILKCPGHSDYRIHAPVAANISQIVGAFREARGITPDLAVYLAFDGDRLDPQSCLADHDITDGDLIDVLIQHGK